MSTHFRQSSYYVRVVVPADLRAILERGEVLRSLRTKRYRIACSRGRLFEAKVARLFDHLREHHHTMTPDTIQALVRKHIEHALDEAEQNRAKRPRKTLEYANASEEEEEESDIWIEGYEVEQSRFAEALYCNDLSVIEPLADSLITQAGMQVDKSAGTYLRLCRELLKASVKVARINLARKMGDYYSDDPSEGSKASNGSQQQGA